MLLLKLNSQKIMIFQAQEDVSKNLVYIKNMLYGTAESEPQADIVVAQLAQELYNSNLLLLLVQNLSRIDFEVEYFQRNKIFIFKIDSQYSYNCIVDTG